MKWQVFENRNDPMDRIEARRVGLGGYECRTLEGTEIDNSIDRYEEFLQTYEELHPTATQLFNGFTIEEMSA